MTVPQSERANVTVVGCILLVVVVLHHLENAKRLNIGCCRQVQGIVQNPSGTCVDLLEQQDEETFLLEPEAVLTGPQRCLAASLIRINPRLLLPDWNATISQDAPITFHWLVLFPEPADTHFN